GLWPRPTAPGNPARAAVFPHVRGPAGSGWRGKRPSRGPPPPPDGCCAGVYGRPCKPWTASSTRRCPEPHAPVACQHAVGEHARDRCPPAARPAGGSRVPLPGATSGRAELHQLPASSPSARRSTYLRPKSFAPFASKAARAGPVELPSIQSFCSLHERPARTLRRRDTIAAGWPEPLTAAHAPSGSVLGNVELTGDVQD